MADKITNFEDYVKSQSKNTGDQTPPAKEDAKQETMETMEIQKIQIEDPFQFLNEKEREEYILHRQQHDGMAQVADERNAKPLPRTEDARRDDHREDYDEEYPEDDEESEPHNGPNMERIVRIASVITGIIILVFIGLILKIRVYDVYFAPDPDEAENVTIAIPEGFSPINDTVVVTGATSLNLRSGPGTDSAIITAVADGTELSRIAVSEDESWAFIEYDGQYLYASMKYLEPQ